ncbi:PREDICTED: uncharacterized protein LOC106551579 [Thamnophis sirtalis]|uniref:Uncharacterized protein LOC106551579 n=1 Tax=Thamnophis sirtalis TaxID=35019 RepID=A0A6I9YN42_9SAUR|nr:PREDICTED: uncharacterized protein LOC106551579 [Thamnophis sirtalis]
MKCRTQCPEGQVVMKSCNATTDMKCGSPFPETSDSSFPSIYIGIGVSIGVVFLAIVIIGCLVYCLYKRRKSKGMKESRDNLISDNENKNSKTEASAPPQDRLPETAEGEDLEMREQDSFLPNRPSVSSSLEAACSNGQSSGGNNVQSSNNPAVRFNTSCMEKLEKTYFQTRNIVLPDDWQRLMRKCGLSDVDLENIKHDNPQHSNERHYQMLRTLRDRKGVVPAFNKILDSLKEMHLNGIYENIMNELISEDLIINATED